MPNLTIYLPTDNLPEARKLASLADECTALCTGILKAALANVHIDFVSVTHGRGHPVFAQIQFRLDPVRTPPVMAEFMEKLDEAIIRHTGFTARIRCFGYAATHIDACN